jgi:hypothetical protein
MFLGFRLKGVMVYEGVAQMDTRKSRCSRWAGITPFFRCGKINALPPRVKKVPRFLLVSWQADP